MSPLVTPGQPARSWFFSLTSRCTNSYRQPTFSSHILFLQSVHNQRNRHFAQKARTVRPPARPLPSAPASRLSAKGDEPSKQIFSPSDVPTLKDWTSGIEGLGAKHLTPIQCVDAAQRYVSAATQHESSWRPRLEQGRHSHTISTISTAGFRRELWLPNPPLHPSSQLTPLRFRSTRLPPALGRNSSDLGQFRFAVEARNSYAALGVGAGI
jgi:hypothetical protein